MSSVQTDVSRQSKVVIIGIIGACAAIGYVVSTWLADNSKKQTVISTVQTSSQGTPTQESEHYAQVLGRYNRQKANAAEQNGDSYLSVLSSRTNTVTTNDQQASQQQQPPQQQAQPPAQPQANAYQQNPQQAKEFIDQVKGLLTNWAPESHGAARVAADGAEYAKSITRAVDNGQTQQTPQGQQAMATKVVDDFALVPALLATDIDTDENSMVTADIPSGKYAGAQLYAMGYKRLTNTVDMTFTFMKWQGRSYKITAKAVDQTSRRTALSGEVNNRYFTRIILPAVANGIGRTGQLYEQSSAQNIITPQGGVIQTYPTTPSATAVQGTIIGGIANQTGQVMANDAANMPVKQVLIAKGSTIGIQFVGPVLSTDDVALGATGTGQQQGVDLNALSQPASQPPRQYPMQAPQGYGTASPPGYIPPGQYPPPGYNYYPR